MKNILYIGRYNGIIGGIERYMQKSAELLRRNGFAIHYLYTENGGRDQAQFAGAFDTAAEFSLSNTLLASADLVMIHNIISPELLKGLPQGRTFFFAQLLLGYTVQLLVERDQLFLAKAYVHHSEHACKAEHGH